MGRVEHWNKPSGGEVVESPYLWGIRDRSALLAWEAERGDPWGPFQPKLFYGFKCVSRTIQIITDPALRQELGAGQPFQTPFKIPFRQMVWSGGFSMLTVSEHRRSFPWEGFSFAFHVPFCCEWASSGPRPHQRTANGPIGKTRAWGDRKENLGRSRILPCKIYSGF